LEASKAESEKHQKMVKDLMKKLEEAKKIQAA